MAMQGIVNRAAFGSPVENAAQGGLARTLRGDYLAGPGMNPYLDPTFSRMAGQVAGNVNSAMNLRGRVGSGANQAMLTSGLGGLAQDVYGRNYEAERGRQMQGYGLAPTFQQMDYANLSKALGVGGAQQAQGQANLENARNVFNYYESLPQSQVSTLLDMLLGRSYGSTTTGRTTGESTGKSTGYQFGQSFGI